MAPKYDMARLDMSSLGTSRFYYDLSSPSRPGSPYVDSSDEDLPAFSNTILRSSIEELSDAQLRAILVKLADTNSRFQRAISKEVACTRVGRDSPPFSAPASPKRKSKTRHTDRYRYRSQTAVQISAPQRVSYDGPVYHPGHLDEEVYEFLPHMLHKAVMADMRVIKMWTCCDEDERSPGCRRAVPYMDNNVKHGELNDMGLPYNNVDVFPDSDLERLCDETAREALRPSSASDL